MKIIRDTTNMYLRKFNISGEVLDRFETILCLHDEGEILPKINIETDDMIICGNYAYEHYQRMKPFNDWNRSGIKKDLKPSIISKIDLIAVDQRKIYYDFLKLDDLEDLYDFPISFITKNNINWLNQNFLTTDYEIRERIYLSKLLGNTKLIIKKGYNEQYNKLVTLFIFNKNDNILIYKHNVDNNTAEHYLGFTSFAGFHT